MSTKSSKNLLNLLSTKKIIVSKLKSENLKKILCENIQVSELKQKPEFEIHFDENRYAVRCILF